MASKFSTAIGANRETYEVQGFNDEEANMLEEKYNLFLESYPTEDEIDKLLLQDVVLTQIMINKAASLNDFTSYAMLTEVLRDQINYLLGDEPEEDGE